MGDVLDDMGPMDDFYSPPEGEEGGEPTPPPPEPGDLTLKQEILDLIARAGIPTLECAVSRAEESQILTLHVPGGSQRLADLLYRYTRNHPEEQEELFLKIRERKGELERLLDQAHRFENAQRIEEALAGFRQYQQMVPQEEDPETASRIIQLEQALHRDEHRRKVFYVKLAVGGVAFLLIVWGVLHLICWRLYSGLQEQARRNDFQAVADTGRQLASIPPVILCPCRRRGIEEGEKARATYDRLDTKVDEAQAYISKGEEWYHEAVEILEPIEELNSPNFNTRCAVLKKPCVSYISARDALKNELPKVEELHAQSRFEEMLAKNYLLKQYKVAAKSEPYKALEKWIAIADTAVSAVAGVFDEVDKLAGAGQYVRALTSLRELMKNRDIQGRVEDRWKRVAAEAPRSLEDAAKGKTWATLAKRIDAVADANGYAARENREFVPPKSVEEARLALIEAGRLQAQLRDEAAALVKGREWDEVLNKAKAALDNDPEKHFKKEAEDIADLAKMAGENLAYLKGLVPEIDPTLGEKASDRKFKDALGKIEKYEAHCSAKDAQLATWRKRLAALQEANRKQADEALKVLDTKPDLDVIDGIQKQIELDDPQAAFEGTVAVQKRIEATVVGLGPWRKLWLKAVEALESHRYDDAEKTFKAAKAESADLKGDIKVPQRDSTLATTKVNAEGAVKAVQGVKAEIEGAAKKMESDLAGGDKRGARAEALAILALDPTNWAGQTPRAAEVCALVALGDRFAQVEGGKFPFGGTRELIQAAIEKGLVTDLNKLRDSLPESSVTLPPYFLGIRLVSVQEYCDFLNAKKPQQEGVKAFVDFGEGAPIVLRGGQDAPYQPADGRGDLPITNVSWTGAAAYCDWLPQQLRQMLGDAGPLVQISCRLPTEAEWEFAAGWDPRAQKKRLLAFGDETLAFPKTLRPVADDTPPLDVSPHGCRDMATNARQWVHDWYGPYPKEERENPQGPETGDKKVIRGGSFEKGLGLTFLRWNELPNGKLADVGFRVVLVLTKGAPGTR